MTTDLGVGAFLLIAFYYLWRHIEKHPKRSLYWSTIAMGSALVSKFSSAMLFPVPFVLMVIARLASFFGRFEQEWRSALLVFFPAVLLFVMISVLADPLGVRYVLPVFPFMKEGICG